MRPTPARLLRLRVTRLDAAADPAAGAGALLRHFTSVMPLWTEPEMTALAGGPAVVDPTEADAAADECLLLRLLAREEPGIVRGPLDRARQHWIGTAPHELAPARRPVPRREAFRAPGSDPGPPSTKPFHLGLYTSTARRDGPGMWRTYLDQGSSLHPRPWHTWELRADPAAEVLEIDGAAAWAAFVRRYPLAHDGSVFPDWRRAAGDFAGVHMTLRAIVATQGFGVRVGGGVAAVPYWDVESSLWLRWVFGEPGLVGVAGPDGE
ncbi:hypothetical protein AF335_06435 [Streptomyces eurocidicus]|uniref:Uncharacterized protein n=1 Tax=Streptomyces eurocidicus TaxID=66423 RepID=A0A2N8NZQ9_STREU|nr:hypothetical protein [Streptomyces eurocidicus]MBB5118769.1 hypothetical protein [Streptomyces eurocidicus]MBF6051423.1 hypothetical protein [Streptomyces eurocidicus]PNE34264.1 hypothetical protein AF335_06435 [Streptomyces eurocidicus]